MKKVWATLRTLGILLALWIVLAGVAWVTGVLPLDAVGDTTPSAPDGGVAASDGIADAVDAGIAEIDAGAPAHDAGVVVDENLAPELPDSAASEPPVHAVARFTVCPATLEPSIAAVQLFGDEKPELVVGCADRWEVIAWTLFGPTRIATFEAPSTPNGQRARTGPAATGDVDGDGHVDVVLPLAYETAQGATRGGGLFWIPRDEFGGIREPVALAPIAAVSVAIAPLDARAGAEVVAMNRANALAQLPSEAWIFGGGGAPARRASVPAGIAGVEVRVGDLDRDGVDDVVSLARDQVGIAFGDGSGAFTRTHVFRFEGAREIALGDVDSDGGVDLAVLGNGLRWIPAGPVGAMEPREVDGVPATLRGISLDDADGDGRTDFIGWDHPHLVVLRQVDEASFALEPVLTLGGSTFGPRRHVLADLDADGRADDLVVLGTAAEDAPVELLLVVDAIGRGEILPASEAVPVPDAPLMLRATLPAS